MPSIRYAMPYSRGRSESKVWVAVSRVMGVLPFHRRPGPPFCDSRLRPAAIVQRQPDNKGDAMRTTRAHARAAAAALLVFSGAAALAQDAPCAHRGDLDTMYCDANRDLV